ncbi:DUF4157 domain-containing protein [Leptobacterium flavescens]|uniref:DUF4157 domain-containing protein n=1 Tax=Leptobacterium flavescens TaxID=472055 RepID=A0A6P0UHG4_9FLAO|nr:DUF4157 domain-containing protein [Leptobacterium flavescens]NER12072.1 DUF4157 domain-containing protein [Leptobacterium flavescens]
MKNIFSGRRNKSPHNNEEAEKSEAPFFSKEDKSPFFNKGNDSAVQKKQDSSSGGLSIGKPGDKYEKEADNMAEAVVNKSTKPDIQNKEISSIQRESLATPQEDEKLGTAEQRMEEDKLVQEKKEIQKTEDPEEEMVNKMDEEKEEDKKVQAKGNPGNQTAGKALSQKIKSKSGKGRKLSSKTKAEMESSFGRNFSEVNIHTDDDAVKMNKELGAQAFTHDKDIYFNSGKFNPDSESGKRLLAHELTHVVQQNDGIQKKESGESFQSASSVHTNPLTGLKKGDGLIFGTFHLRPRVQLLQQKLNEKTLSGLAIDGMFGPKTMTALRYFRAMHFIPPQKQNEDSPFDLVSFGPEAEEKKSDAAFSDEVVDPLTADALMTPLGDVCNENNKPPQPFELKRLKDSTPMNNPVCSTTGILRVKGIFKWIESATDFRLKIEVFRAKGQSFKEPIAFGIVHINDEDTLVNKVIDVPENDVYHLNFKVLKPEKGKALKGKGHVFQTK